MITGWWSHGIGLLKNRKATFKTQKDLFSDLQAKMEAFKDAANAIRKSSSFLDFKASTDNEGYLTASASSSATAGTHVIDVNTLAKAEVSSSAGYADKDTTGHGTGILQITVGGSTTNINITSSNNTLDGIAAAINAEDGLDVTATVMNTGDPATPYKLVLSADNMGTAGAFTVGTDAADPTLTAFASSIDSNEDVAGTDAVFTVNNIQITRSSNTISDVIPGVTLTLTGVHPSTGNTTTTLTISTDGTATAEKVKKFVDTYNEIVDFVNKQNEVTINDSGSSLFASGDNNEPRVKANPLIGDSTLRTIQRTLRGIMGSSVDTGDQSYALLAQVGIDSDRDGKLTFNQSEFEEALPLGEAAIKDLFTKTGEGIADRVFDQLETFTDSIDGIVKTRIDGIDRNNQDIDRQIARLEERLERFEQRLVDQFTTMELTLARLQQQAGSLIGLTPQS
ncbi:MAG: flagellar filament capping protein FliD [Planctomycetota bacterium]